MVEHQYLFYLTLEINSLYDVKTIWYIISNTLTNAIDALVLKYKTVLISNLVYL